MGKSTEKALEKVFKVGTAFSEVSTWFPYIETIMTNGMF